MNLKRSDVQSSLQKKGFTEKRSGDHIFYLFFHEGKKTSIRTRVSHGTKYKTLGNDLVSSMAKQCRLSKGDFCELVNCTLSAERYLIKLIENGEI